mmetsp:Transcript_26504/g.67396  ORF Transcript_26504/g.67396 Transcript_26504/m.67396 type:complete len:214 (-) Transcript_26504:2889-3530(-)
MPGRHPGCWMPCSRATSRSCCTPWRPSRSPSPSRWAWLRLTNRMSSGATWSGWLYVRRSRQRTLLQLHKLQRPLSAHRQRQLLQLQHRRWWLQPCRLCLQRPRQGRRRSWWPLCASSWARTHLLRPSTLQMTAGRGHQAVWQALWSGSLLRLQTAQQPHPPAPPAVATAAPVLSTCKILQHRSRWRCLPCHLMGLECSLHRHLHSQWLPRARL